MTKYTVRVEQDVTRCTSVEVIANDVIDTDDLYDLAVEKAEARGIWTEGVKNESCEVLSQERLSDPGQAKLPL
jgi:hypothetical protein